MAANQLQAITSAKKNSYGIFGSIYISQDSMKICRENNIGFIDIAGETRVLPESLDSVKKKLEGSIKNYLNREFFEKF